MLNFIVSLAVQTVMQPRQAAARLSAYELPRAQLWPGLALVVVLNALAYQLSVLSAELPAGFPSLLASPLLFTAMLALGLILTIYAIYYVGRALGGKGSFERIMTLLIWLQVMRLLVQLAAFILTPLSPALGGLLVFGASLYGIWIVLNFVDVGHEINSLFTSFGILVMSLLAIMLGMAVALSIIGIQNLGLTPYV